MPRLAKLVGAIVTNRRPRQYLAGLHDPVVAVFPGYPVFSHVGSGPFAGADHVIIFHEEKQTAVEFERPQWRKRQRSMALHSNLARLDLHTCSIGCFQVIERRRVRRQFTAVDERRAVLGKVSEWGVLRPYQTACRELCQDIPVLRKQLADGELSEFARVISVAGHLVHAGVLRLHTTCGIYGSHPQERFARGDS